MFSKDVIGVLGSTIDVPVGAAGEAEWRPLTAVVLGNNSTVLIAHVIVEA